jgi:hypothetical protein
LRDRPGRPRSPRSAASGIENRAIWISRIDGIAAPGYYQEGYKVRLKEHVYVDVLAKVTAVPDEKLSTGCESLNRLKSVLNIQPFRKRCPKVFIGRVGVDSLIDFLGAEPGRL